MDLNKHYDELYHQSVQKFRDDNYGVDSLVNDPLDSRYGLTLRIRPPLEIQENIESVLKQVQQIEPNQYYYPKTDFHITVLSIISCFDGFDVSEIDISDYSHRIAKNLHSFTNFDIQLKGITASSSAFMIRGFLMDDTLNQVRESLRTELKKSALEHTIDKRYTITTAYSTILRICQPVSKKRDFLAIIDTNKHYEFGTFTVDQMELVLNDWYHKVSKIKVLQTFDLH